jgi:hypothetical protein
MMLYIRGRQYKVKIEEEDGYSASVEIKTMQVEVERDDEEKAEEEDEEQEETFASIKIQIFKKEGKENVFVVEFSRGNADFYTFNQFYKEIYRANYGVELL